MIQSSIHYMGNKFKLLPQMLPYFPKNINRFYDLFGGSATVSLNIKANEYHINDLSNHVYNLYKLFKETSADEIIKYCYENRDKWGFTINETVKKEIAKLNKEPFEKCRDYMNENPTTLGYYFLTFYSFCNQFRFNRDNKFNMPVGNGYFKKESEQPIRSMCKFFNQENVYIYQLSYEKVDLSKFDKNKDFIYMDLPYANTDATYNEVRDNDGWGEEQDYEFFKFCEKLNEKGFRFAISNVFCNKGLENNHLKEWCEKNNFIVHHLNMKYASHGVDNNFTDEVLICNYGEEDKDLFDL